jgi:hypothetical protein
MPKSKRDIGAEILQSLREIKRGQYGRVITVPDVAKTREKTGLSQACFARCVAANPAGLGAGPPCAFGGRSHPAHGCREKPASVARSSMTGLSSVELGTGRGTIGNAAIGVSLYLPVQSVR